jgi:ATP-binding cassette subfamily B (MDR/TAP) protein 1
MVGIFVQGFWFGLFLVDQGMDPGHVLTTFYACLAAMQSVETVLPQWLVLAKGMSAGETLKSIKVQMEHGRKVIHMVGMTKPMSSPGDIEVNEVSS